MSCKNAIILGGNSLNNGIYEKLKTLGFHVSVVDYRENISFKSDTHLVFNAIDKNISPWLRSNGYDNIDLVYTSMDNAGLAQNAICKEYGLLSASDEAVIKAHNKHAMHDTWARDGLLNRLSLSLQQYDDTIASMNQHKRIIIKPSDACASRGMSILNRGESKDKLKQAFDYALKFSTNQYVNIEEFVCGTEFSVEMVGDDYGNVAVFAIAEKHHSKYATGIVATKLHYNSLKYSESFFNEIADFSIACYKNLDLRNTFGHLEVIRKEDGTFSPVEIGSRSSGYIASHFTDFSTNNSYLSALYDVQHGKQVQNGLVKQSDISSCYFFYDFPIDLPIKKECNLMDFLGKNIQSHAFDRSKIKKNNTFNILTQDTDRHGFEIISGQKNLLTIENIINTENQLIKEMFHG